MPGSVVLDFPVPGGTGYTVLGSPTVIADLTVTAGFAEHSLLAARLLDVDANGDELLVARGVYRPDASGQQVFQLAPMGFHIAPDHHLQLELLGQEAPTMRPSNLPFAIDVANLEVRVPVAEAPDGAQIQAVAPRVLPPGYLPEPAFPVLGASGAALVGDARAQAARAEGDRERPGQQQRAREQASRRAARARRTRATRDMNRSSPSRSELELRCDRRAQRVVEEGLALHRELALVAHALGGVAPVRAHERDLHDRAPHRERDRERALPARLRRVEPGPERQHQERRQREQVARAGRRPEAVPEQEAAAEPRGSSP